VSKFEIALTIYLAFGLLGYISISGVGAGSDGKRKVSRIRKVLAILLWPLAMIGAIEN
jgi:hypothetical protein